MNKKTNRLKGGRFSVIRRELIRNRYLYLLAVPVIAYYIIFCYLPIGGIAIAFKQYDLAKGIWDSSWVGLKYFKEFFESLYFPRLMKNTLLISIYDLLLGFPAPVIFALLLNELRGSFFKKMVQTITYLPHFISLVVICGMITDFFSTEGIITKILAALGGEQINYLGDPAYFRSIYVWTNVWQGIGWGSIVYLAAISGIDQELYEAAVIDGAGRLRQALSVTLPCIAPTIIIMLILRMGSIMSVGFEKIILLYSPATYETGDVIASFVYRRGLGTSAQYSYATAVGLFQSIVNLVLLFAANRISKRVSETSLF